MAYKWKEGDSYFGRGTPNSLGAARRRKARMANRTWRVVGSFHTVGEVVVIVQAPNWNGGLRKGVLALKSKPEMKGRRITVGSFTLQEVEAVVIPADPTQGRLIEQVTAVGLEEGEREQGDQTPDSKV